MLERANARAERIGRLQEDVIDKLKVASARLRDDSVTYERGYEPFIRTLRKADDVLAREEAASDVVQGILVGTVLGVIEPAGLALTFGLSKAGLMARALDLLARTRRQEVASKALQGLINEGLEPAATALVSAAQKAASRPSATAGRGGPEPGTQYKMAVRRLNDLIFFLPNLIPLQRTQHRLVSLALEAAESGDPTFNDFVALLDGMTEIVVVPLCESLTPPFENLTQAILSSPPGTPAGVEQMLWAEWVSALSSPYDELNYRVVRARLAEIGLSHLFTGTHGAMTGEYSGEEVTSESRKQINVNARVFWLQSRNVPVTTGSGRAIDMLFEVGSAREALARQVTQGRRGKYVGQRRIDVDGAIVPVAGLIPPAASEGDAVVVDTVHPSWFHLRYLAEEYATTGVHSQNIVDVGSVGVEVLWDLYRDRLPFRYP